MPEPSPNRGRKRPNPETPDTPDGQTERMLPVDAVMRGRTIVPMDCPGTTQGWTSQEIIGQPTVTGTLADGNPVFARGTPFVFELLHACKNNKLKVHLFDVNKSMRPSQPEAAPAAPDGASHAAPAQRVLADKIQIDRAYLEGLLVRRLCASLRAA